MGPRLENNNSPEKSSGETPKSGDGPSAVDRGTGPDLSRGELFLAKGERTIAQRSAAAPAPPGYGVLDGKPSHAETVEPGQRLAKFTAEQRVQPAVAPSVGRPADIDIATSHPRQTVQVGRDSDLDQTSRSKPSHGLAPIKDRHHPLQVEEQKGSHVPTLPNTASRQPTTGSEYQSGDRRGHNSSTDARPHTLRPPTDAERSGTAPIQRRQSAQISSETTELLAVRHHHPSDPATPHSGPTAALPTSPEMTAAQYAASHPTSGKEVTPTGNERAPSNYVACEVGSADLNPPHSTPEATFGLYTEANPAVRHAEPAATCVANQQESGQIREQLSSPETAQIVDDLQAQEASIVFAIEGRAIHQTSGAPIIGAAINGGLLGIRFTDLLGGFCFDNVPTGTGYSCHASKRGLSFKPSVTNGVVSGPVWIEFEAED